MARLLWAGCCIGFFDFLRAGEFTSTGLSSCIRVSDIAMDNHQSPSVVQIFIRRAKTDPFGKGINIILGRALCLVVTILNYLRSRPPGDGPLLVLQDGRPLTKSMLVGWVRKALTLAGIDQGNYASHSFRIGAATAAAAAGVPAHMIKMMGRWSSDAYTLYISNPERHWQKSPDLWSAAL